MVAQGSFNCIDARLQHRQEVQFRTCHPLIAYVSLCLIMSVCAACVCACASYAMIWMTARCCSDRVLHTINTSAFPFFPCCSSSSLTHNILYSCMFRLQELLSVRNVWNINISEALQKWMVDFLKIHYGCNRSRISLNLIPSSYPYPSILSAPLPLRAELKSSPMKWEHFKILTHHTFTCPTAITM